MTLLFKVLYRLYYFASGRWYWARRRFTRAGLAVLGVLILTASLAPDTDNNLTYQALPLLLFLLLVAAAMSRFFTAPFTATRHEALAPEDVFIARYAADGAIVRVPRGPERRAGGR